VSWGNEAIDCGPTVFTLKHIFERIFAACGESLEDHITLKPLDILARHFWPDGSSLDLYADKDASAEAIREFAGPHEAKAFLGFMATAERNWRTLYRPMIEQEEASFPRLLAQTPPQRLVRLNPYISLWQEVSGRFKDPRLRQLFGRYATYCGSSPFEAPGVLSMIAHIEQQGVWTIDGGMSALAHALERLARRRGVKFHFDTEIERLHLPNGEVRGVVNGRLSETEAVVFNGDVAALSEMGAATTSATTRASRSLSAVTMCAKGLAEGPALPCHNVFFSSDYEAEFRQLRHARQVPSEPTVYLYAPDAAEADGLDGRYMALINAPPDGERSYSEREVQEYREVMLAQMKRCGTMLTPDPKTVVMTTPTDFAIRFPRTGGALYGRPVHGWRASFQRPGIRTPIPGLYCAGGSVHPGSGVPMAALSGYMAARAVMRDFALT
jgi:1-hydroxycarotenoid 3,4-desaturase